ncbi:hypothetical protein HII31_10505 [Pseudocercospora fuligena]|uniref:Protein kinase domain-containing protein n=1 Tax=Pseudocercospora fuligena TaxID=685502 RepID=A0A8H6RAB2_9PEZI|nr:hypothetical protein HII31_10505 [Pseudocercospora fuligena]
MGRNIVDLDLISDEDTTRKIPVKIVDIHRPFTLSCVLTVEISGQDIGHDQPVVQAILKLYDRRFAEQLRKDERIGPWTEEIESAFSELVRGGNAAEFVRKLREEDDFEEPDEGWSPAENEAYLHNECSELFLTEVKAYTVLQTFQGKQIPKLYSAVTLRTAEAGESDQEKFLSINGVLIEYISGPTISNMTESVPRGSWQSIVDQAVQIVRSYSQLGILNKDIRPTNFIVNDAVPDGDDHRVVMLDLALCRFRKPEESEAEWGREKWCEDEEGAIGRVMQTRFAKVGFELNYSHSHQWIEWAPGEDDD